MIKRLGILGGTFNPIHLGHLSAAQEVRERLQLDKVLFIPSFIPPHKQEKDMPTPMQRMEMVRLATAGNIGFDAVDIEIQRGGRSYTIDTIEELRVKYSGAELFFIIGLDSFLEIRTWKEWRKLVTLCVFVVLSREGFKFRDLAALDFLETKPQVLELIDQRSLNECTIHSNDVHVILENIPLFEISSTDIRVRIREGRSAKYFLPEAVERYIIEHKLYVERT